MPDEVQLFAPAPAAHQSSPDFARWEPSLGLAQLKRPWPLDVTVQVILCEKSKRGDGAVRTNEEQVNRSHIRVSQEIHWALRIGLPVPPLCWVPLHPGMRVVIRTGHESNTPKQTKQNTGQINKEKKAQDFEPVRQRVVCAMMCGGAPSQPSDNHHSSSSFFLSLVGSLFLC